MSTDHDRINDEAAARLNTLVARRETIGFRKAVPPEPKRYAQCRNCKHLAYDDHFYMPMSGKGGERSRKVNLRCRQHDIAVNLGCVCDAHEFAYHDRSDR